MKSNAAATKYLCHPLRYLCSGSNASKEISKLACLLNLLFAQPSEMLNFCICSSDSHLSQPLTQAARQSQTSSCLRRKLGKTLLESLDLIQKSTSAAIYSFTYLTLIISWQNKLAHKRFSPSIYSWSKDDSYIFTFIANFYVSK